MRTSTTALLSSALLTLAGTARAQEPVYTLGAEATNGDSFGYSVGDAGDVDLDGVPDVVVGAPFDDASGTSSGSVFVYSGATGALLWTRAGMYPQDLFGWSVDGVGDINGDGHSDVVVGAPLYDFTLAQPNGGAVYVLSGATGATLVSVFFNEANAQLGYAVRGLGDIDGDGVGDYAFGVPYRDDSGKVDAGFVQAFSGATTTTIFFRYGTESGAFYGYSIGVVRAEGALATSRVLVGAPGVNGAGVDRGQGQLLSSLGTLITSFNGSTNNEWFGSSAAGVGDANSDGWPDFAFGAPYADLLGVGGDAGVVRVYNGSSLAQMHSVAGATASARFGSSLAGVGDFDGNGSDDFLVGAPYDSSAGNETGEARLVSGTSGLTIQSWKGGPSDRLGQSVSSAGDLNGDGFGDVVFGARYAPFGAGEAYVHLAKLDAPTVYCTAKLNSQGCTPTVGATGTPSLSIANDLHVTAAQLINNKLGIAFWGFAPNTIPLGGGTVCVTPYKRVVMGFSGGNPGADDCSGGFDLHVSHAFMAAESLAPGDRVHVQFWSRDTADAFGISLTDAVAFDIVP